MPVDKASSLDDLSRVRDIAAFIRLPHTLIPWFSDDRGLITLGRVECWEKRRREEMGVGVAEPYRRRILDFFGACVGGRVLEVDEDPEGADAEGLVGVCEVVAGYCRESGLHISGVTGKCNSNRIL